MANIYTKSMSQALQEARDYRDTSDIDEGSYRGYEIKRQNNKYGHPLIVPALKLTGANMKDIKQLIDRHYLFSNEEELDIEEGKGFLEYDEWLKQAKGIKKGAYGINSDEHAKYSGEWRAYVTKIFNNLSPADKAKNVTKLSPTAHTKLGENKLDEIVGGHGDMTITKDGGVMIIKSKDWQTYKAKGWAKKTNESLDLSATGDTITSNASQEVEGEELDEAKRIRPIKGLWTMAQMKKQVARTEKAFREFEQHCDFIFQMDADIGPSMGDNSGKYWNVHSVLDKANNQIKKALADAKRIT
jgi:hypothetical protein